MNFVESEIKISSQKYLLDQSLRLGYNILGNIILQLRQNFNFSFDPDIPLDVYFDTLKLIQISFEILFIPLTSLKVLESTSGILCPFSAIQNSSEYADVRKFRGRKISRLRSLY